MSHNAYIRPANVWSGSKTFLTVELTALALQAYQSINGDLGGAWAPSSIITIGGSGMEITGPSAFADIQSFTLDGPGELTNTASIVWRDTTFATFLEDAQLVMQGDAVLYITEDATIAIDTSQTISVASAISFSAGSHAYSGNTISGAQTRTGSTTYSGTGARRVGRQISNADVNVTYGNEVDTILYAQTNGTNHVLTLRVSVDGSSPAAAAGERLRVLYRRTVGQTGSLRIDDENVGGLLIFGNAGGSPVTAADNRGGAEFEFDGTQWRVAAFWGYRTSVDGYSP